MELSKLQIDLRPRPNAQALDLGYALLRAHAKDSYLAWNALWLPLVTLCGAMAWLSPGKAGYWLFAAWWLRPLLERAPLYVLSRRVFGEEVTWKQALRAWPSQLGGGWFRLLTWWRPFSAARGLYHPVWQLEGARGSVATERRKIISRNGTGRAASWFGVACAHFEGILQLGLLTFIGIFISDSHAVNPFAFLAGKTEHSPLLTVFSFSCYALSGAIVGPIYTACCFTLYLNRRATLEAWDIEIKLRQIAPFEGRKIAAALALLPAILFVGLMSPQPQARAGTKTEKAQNLDKCEAPKWLPARVRQKGEPNTPEQARLRAEVKDIFSHKDLSGYTCEESWVPKDRSEPEKKPVDKDWLRTLALVATVLKAVLIAAAIGLVVWLLYRYREKLSFLIDPVPRRATEVGGFDIRPESLPDDVTAEVLALWKAGERRAALALLYRATLSRLAHAENILLSKGATEGDCLRLAHLAQSRKQLSDEKFRAVALAIELWMNGAYGNRWAGSDEVTAACADWRAQFHDVREGTA